MELRFFGALGTTTGSCHMLRVAGQTILLDCGMFQGRRDEAWKRNERFGFDPTRVDAVLQSHAHIDHSGKLPMLTRRGYRGPIYATSATRDLCAVMLHDSAHILLSDAQHLNRQRIRKALLAKRLETRRRADERRERRAQRQRQRGGARARASSAGAEHAEPRAEASLERVIPVVSRNARFRLPGEVNLPEREVLPLFLDEDVDDALALFTTRAYGEWFDVTPAVRARFHDAGHILGSAWIEAEIRDHGRLVRFVFTGDYGRRGQPILRDPEPLAPAEVYVCESTYGDRVHPPFESLESELADAVRRLAARGRGRLLVPAFAVGRTQNLLYMLARLFREQRTPPVRIVVDSPLATAATRIVLAHPECFDDEALIEYRHFESDPEFRRWLHFTDSVDQSKELNTDPRPTLILSASGMMESGRILHHLAWHVGSPDTEILIVGFQSRDTLGRRLLDGATTIRLLGMEHTVRARITPLFGFSAHADRRELLAALAPHVDQAQAVFLVHGEEDQRTPLARELSARGFRRVECPVDSRSWRV